MKLIKGIFLTFILSIVLSMTGVSAAHYITFNEITVPALRQSYTSSTQHKNLDVYNQSFYTVTTNKPSEARVYGCINNNLASSWKTSVENSTVYWTDAGCDEIGNYQFQLRSKNFNVTSFKYWGLWTYDPLS